MPASDRVKPDNSGLFFQMELTREAGDTLTTSLLPGLEMPLQRIFEG